MLWSHRLHFLPTNTEDESLKYGTILGVFSSFQITLKLIVYRTLDSI